VYIYIYIYAGKAQAKEKLQKELGLDVNPHQPIVAFIG
jgi:glycogen synthase